jgi:hypothetical protein
MAPAGRDLPLDGESQNAERFVLVLSFVDPLTDLMASEKSPPNRMDTVTSSGMNQKSELVG